MSCGARSNRQCLCEYWAVWLINCWVSCVRSWRRETDSPICREATHSAERKCHQQISPISPPNRGVLSPVSSFSLCFSRFVSSPFPPCSSSLPFPPPRVLTCLILCLSLLWRRLPFVSLSPSLLSDFLLSGPRTRAGNKRDTCQSKKGLRWARVMLRQSVSLIISPPPEWCVPESLVLSLSLPTWHQSVASLWAEGSARSISAQLSVAPSELVYSFYCRQRWDSHGGNGPAHIQLIHTDTHTHTHSHTLKQSAARAVDKVAMATGCPASVSEHLYSIRTCKCDHMQEHTQKKANVWVAIVEHFVILVRSTTFNLSLNSSGQDLAAEIGHDIDNYVFICESLNIRMVCIP